MGKVNDLAGLRFERLAVVARVENSRHGETQWLCRCDCGGDVVVLAGNLKAGRATSCGCWRYQLAIATVAPMIGKTYHRLKVIERDGYMHRRPSWKCLCECGTTVTVSGKALRSGHTQSCGCLQQDRTSTAKAIDIAGHRYSRLVAQRPVERTRGGKVKWKCVCDCGKECVVDGTSLRSGHIRSCGCLHKDAMSAALLMDMTGRRIGEWTVIERAANDTRGRVTWLCRHDDGRQMVRLAGGLQVEADPTRQLIRVCRLRVYFAFKNASVKKCARTLELLGCTGAELVAHLAAQFEPGMTLENHGAWHIDHKRPVSSFDLTDPEQVKACFHYSNLQPLWAKHNLAKSDRLDWSHPSKQHVESGVVA